MLQGRGGCLRATQRVPRSTSGSDGERLWLHGECLQDVAPASNPGSRQKPQQQLQGHSHRLWATVSTTARILPRSAPQVHSKDLGDGKQLGTMSRSTAMMKAPGPQHKASGPW